MQTNSPNTTNKIYDEYKKIFCAYHKTEFLTNFCVHSNSYSDHRKLSHAVMPFLHCRSYRRALQRAIKATLYEFT